MAAAAAGEAARGAHQPQRQPARAAATAQLATRRRRSGGAHRELGSAHAIRSFGHLNEEAGRCGEAPSDDAAQQRSLGDAAGWCQRKAPAEQDPHASEASGNAFLGGSVVVPETALADVSSRSGAPLSGTKNPTARKPHQVEARATDKRPSTGAEEAPLFNAAVRYDPCAARAPGIDDDSKPLASDGGGRQQHRQLQRQQELLYSKSSDTILPLPPPQDPPQQQHSVDAMFDAWENPCMRAASAGWEVLRLEDLAPGLPYLTVPQTLDRPAFMRARVLQQVRCIF